MMDIDKRIRNDLDLYVGITGIVLGFLTSSLYLISNTIELFTFGAALSFASIIYLIIRNKEDSECFFKNAKNLKLLSEILFFSLFTISILLLYLNTSRPPLYFVLVALCSGFLVISILFVKTKTDVIFQLIKILGLSFNLRFSILDTYAGSGVDYWQHLHMNSLLSQTGNIQVLFDKEIFFPFMHIQVAINQILLAIPIRAATIVGISVPLILSTIFVFLVARKFFDERIGLLAMLIVAISEYSVLWAVQPQTTSFGLCIFFFMIFLFIQGIFHRDVRWIMLFVLLVPIMLFSHAVSSFITLTALLGLLVGTLLYRLSFDDKSPLVYVSVVIMYGLGLVAHWFNTQYNQSSGESIFDKITSSLIYEGREHGQILNRPESVTSYAAQLPPFIERIADNLGISLLIFFAVIACLFWLSKRYRTKDTFSMIVSTMLLLGITLVFPFFGLRNIMPSRWFAFIYFFLSIMASFAIIKFSMKSGYKPITCLVPFVIVVVLTFFMVSGTTANEDSPLWLEESTISTTYTIQEVSGAEFLSLHSDNLISDSRFGRSVLIEYLGVDDPSSPSMKENAESGRRMEGNTYIWRNYMASRPVRNLKNIEGYYSRVESNEILGKEMLGALQAHQKVYENDDISAYRIYFE